MADPSPSLRPASFWSQANALLRKNLTFQKRNKKSTIRLIFFPIILCLLIFALQLLVNGIGSAKSTKKCGCKENDMKGDGQTKKICGIGEDGTCPIPHPHEWPPLLQIPAPQYRTVKTDSLPFPELPDASCRADGSCPATFLFTGTNQSLGEALVGNMFSSSFVLNSSDVFNSLSQNVLGSSSWPEPSQFIESEFVSGLPVYDIQRHCSKKSVPQVIKEECAVDQLCLNIELICTRGLSVWRKSAAEVNNEIYKGYWNGNPDGKINEITAAYDLLNTDRNNFNVSIWYNSTYATSQKVVLRVPRSMNLVSNAYLQFLKGPGTKMLFEFVKEMPKHETFKLDIDISSIIGPLFFTWVVLMLFPVILSSLVYEKEQRLRIMMKMHGLGDGPYWLISYAYFLVLSVTYMLSFVIFGSLIGLKFFHINQYSLQFVFYFLYLNLQISLAFLLSALFSNVKTATVVAYIFVFGTGLLGDNLFTGFVQDASFSRGWIIAMELYPGFALYRGLYELAEGGGLQWNDLSDSSNGIKEVLIIIAFEWLIVLLVAYHIDKISGSGKSARFFIMKKKSPSFNKPGIQMDKPDVNEEREKVEQLLHESRTNYALIVDDLKKVYPGRDGNPDKFAVKSLSLAVPRGECFGMLGPNGAGKTSFISMMIGLTKPTSGAAYVEGYDIGTDMNSIYTSIGVCPQHDLLWETLTGREHLLFYGRLKNLKGLALTQAVEESLKSVNLYYGGVADKQAGKYSGGMKRRLSVAISLIGDPKVVYMDEPSTGLDPASRNKLWDVVKQAKRSRAIILTTHSMEEADALCDRLGIFVDGSLQCIGNPKELKTRYGGCYVLTVTTSVNHDEDVERLVRGLCREGKRVYKIAGTQKFELPKDKVKIAQVVRAVEYAKTRFGVEAWGLADTTLEDVFIKIAGGPEHHISM